MTAPLEKTLQVSLSHCVHPGLTIDVSLTLGAQCGVVFGPSGAGKTTLLRMIAGLSRPDRGHVILNGEKVYDSKAGINQPLRLRRIGMVFQDDLLFPHLDVAANIRFGLHRLIRTETERRLKEVAELCGVESLLPRMPATLSGGERQRVGLARALAPRPRLLLCDEPVSALDLASRNALIDRLRIVRANEPIPVLYVTHSPAEALALGDRLFLLNEGRIIAAGAPLDVLATHGTSAHFQGVRNVFPALIHHHAHDEGATYLKLTGGPELVVPHRPDSPGSCVSVAVLAEEILLARGPIAGLSARNVIPGIVNRVVTHGTEAEVLVQTDALVWIVSVVAPAVSALGLQPGADVHMIIKARSCQVETTSNADGNH